MRILVQIVQNFLSQSKACVMVTVEDSKTQRYHFNIPDGTQRYAKEHQLNFTKGSRFFFTELTPEHAGGLLGLMCTMSAQDRSEDTCIYGAGIVPFLESSRYLMQLNMNVQSCYDFDSKQSIFGFANPSDLVQHFVKGVEYSPQQQYNFNKFMVEKALKTNDAKRYIQPDNSFKDDNLSISTIVTKNSLGKSNVSYILRTKTIAGKVIKEKLKEFNIPPKLTGQLMKEGKVTLPDGTVVLAAQVKEEDVTPQVIVICDFSDEEVLSQIIESEALKGLQRETEISGEGISCLVSMATNVKLLETSEFSKNFISGLSPKQHLIVNQDCSQSIKRDNYEVIRWTHDERVNLTAKLHSGFPKHFPNLSLENITSRFPLMTESEESADKSDKENIGCPYREHVVYPFKNQNYQVLGSLTQKMKSSKKPKDITAELLADFAKLSITSDDGLDTKTDEAKKEVQGQLVFLGTGSMIPLPSRTVSAILIESKQGNILLDCGEGTYSQILYQYGLKKGLEIIKGIKLIFISHIHLDHCAGMFYLLQKRDELLRDYEGDKDIFIMVSTNLAPLIRVFDKYSFKFAAHNKFVMTNDYVHGVTASDEIPAEKKEAIPDFDDLKGVLSDGQKLEPYEHPKQLEIVQNYFAQSTENIAQLKAHLAAGTLGISTIDVCEVIHCGESFGIALTLTASESGSNFKISYSGDTRPCSRFEEIAAESDIFIHECTFSDDLQKNAEENNHATLTEAIESCKISKSKKLVLTHFSQRYSLIDVDQFKGDSEFLRNNTIVAFDHFQATFDHYRTPVYLSTLTQAAQKVFVSDDE